METGRGRRWITTEDVVWVLLFGALVGIHVAEDPLERPLLSALAVLQILEPRLRFFQTPHGQVAAVLAKLGLCYLLIGFTGGVNSSYFLLLLVPIITGATAFGPLGALLVALVTAGSYVSFLLWLDWTRYFIGAYELRELGLRLLIFGVVAYLANRQAALTREQSRRYKAVAEQLAATNRSLQEAEAAVRRSERLAALGQLSAGLAHELRNPLGTIKASAEMLSKQLSGEQGVARELAEYISSEVDRTNLLVTRFLDFARPLQLRLATTDLAEVLDRAITQFERAAARPDVAVFKNYAPDIRPFPMDGELMERVFFNLLLNAAQASPPEGAVTVKTRPADGMAEIAVIDRGEGIDPRHLESIFNPFFTTKPEGIGLGLAIVSKIVDEHRGRITVESQPGKGSVFRVYLPVTPGLSAGETPLPASASLGE